jgi:hypothetical protein
MPGFFKKTELQVYSARCVYLEINDCILSLMRLCFSEVSTTIFSLCSVKPQDSVNNEKKQVHVLEDSKMSS